MLCYHDEENSNWQHTDNDSNWHDSYMQQINNHLNEVTEINNNSIDTETWKSTSLEKCKALSQMMKQAQNNHDKVFSHASHYSR